MDTDTVKSLNFGCNIRFRDFRLPDTGKKDGLEISGTIIVSDISAAIKFRGGDNDDDDNDGG